MLLLLLLLLFLDGVKSRSAGTIYACFLRQEDDMTMIIREGRVSIGGVVYALMCTCESEHMWS